MRIPVNYVILEGTDLSGKTTLYNNIHRATGFEWNIQDRSALSMLSYARQYGRDTRRWREQLREEINNLNNRHIVLMPDLDIIQQRLIERGDEFQDSQTILRLRDIFEDEVSRIDKFPNVLVIRANLKHQELADLAVQWVRSTIRRTPKSLADDIADHAEASGGETHRLCVDAEIDSGFAHTDTSCLSNPEERDYYSRVRAALSVKIRQEIAGLNDYNVPQSSTSRRFIHTEDTCISLIHVMLRGGKVHITATLRSSNVSKTLPLDLDFLYILAADVCREIREASGLEIVLHLGIQSAHLVP